MGLTVTSWEKLACLPPSLLLSPPSSLSLSLPHPLFFFHILSSFLSSIQYLSDTDRVPYTVLGPGHEEQTISDEAYIPSGDEDNATK